MVAAAAAHAVPADIGEDDIKVCLVLRPNTILPLAEFFEHCKQSLPYFAMPRYVEFMESLPLTPTQRVMKHVLVERGIGEAVDLEALGFKISRDERR
jgi:carnitine-CoA ligase